VGARVLEIYLVLTQALLILLLKTQVRLTPLLMQPRLPLLRETVKLSPLLTILVQTLLLNALLLPFLFLAPLRRPSLLLLARPSLLLLSITLLFLPPSIMLWILFLRDG
jgi:hypothetical protein